MNFIVLWVEAKVIIHGQWFASMCWAFHTPVSNLLCYRTKICWLLAAIFSILCSLKLTKWATCQFFPTVNWRIGTIVPVFIKKVRSLLHSHLLSFTQIMFNQIIFTVFCSVWIKMRRIHNPLKFDVNHYFTQLYINSGVDGLKFLPPTVHKNGGKR